tara:strand:+ start:1887 stop:4019 length:2133 start_codon:yes stop_codon:yes gene_type:complete
MSTEFKEDKQPINQVQYATKDYPSFYDSILSRLRDNYGSEYNDFASSSVGIMFVNLMSYAMGQLSWYLDRRSSESYLATARTLDSVTRLATQIGYKPKRASASSVDLTITFDALNADVIMPQGFSFSGEGGLNFQLMNDVLLSVGQTTKLITVSEGEQRTQTFTSDGEPNQFFILPGVKDGEYVSDQSVRVFVNRFEWSENDFLTYEKTGQFAVFYTTDPPRVVLGDGSAGLIPDLGAEIRIDYRIIHAESGNVRSNTITTANDSLIVAGTSVSINSVTNIEPASGGSGPQSISEIKKIAPLAFQAGGSAVTQQDYYALVNSFSDPVYGSISKGYAGITRSTDLDNRTSGILHALNTHISTVLTQLNHLEQLQNQVNLISDDFFKISLETQNVSLETQVMNGLLDEVEVLSREASNESSTVASDLTVIERYISELNSYIDALEANPAPVNVQDEIERMRPKISQIETLVQSAKTHASNSSQYTSTGIPQKALVIKNSVASVNGFTTNIDDLTNQALRRLSGEDGSVLFIALWIDATVTPIMNESQSIIVELREHLNGLFDDSCKSNVVTVPILVEGREGFYQAPSRGLTRALQKYLDEVKEVTHLVRVVSGATALVPADITLKIKYDPRVVKAEVRAEVESGLDFLLRRRDFHDALYISDVYSVVELVDGIDHVSIVIDSPPENIDNDGNLIIGELEVVTKGTIIIEEIL